MRPKLLISATVTLALVGAPLACSDDDTTTGDGAASGTTTSSTPGAGSTTVPVAGLKVLVTNDDGYGSDGIDAVVEALRVLPDTEVNVVAPLENQSGQGGKTTPGTLVVTDVTTRSGYPAKAVAGHPADAVIWAIDQHGIDFTPDLVVSGINAGQNLGPLLDVSGTVGAARAAGARHLAAVAVSQGITDYDFPTGVKALLEWLSANRAELVPGKMVNINAPSCPAGTSVLGTIEVPSATTDSSGNPFGPQACVAGTTPVDDVGGFNQGYVTVSPLEQAA